MDALNRRLNYISWRVQDLKEQLECAERSLLYYYHMEKYNEINSEEGMAHIYFKKYHGDKNATNTEN